MTFMSEAPESSPTISVHAHMHAYVCWGGGLKKKKNEKLRY